MVDADLVHTLPAGFRCVAADADLTKDDAAVLLERDEVRRLIDGKPVIKQVFVPGRLLNLVVKG